MIESFDRNQLIELAGSEGGAHLSIFVPVPAVALDSDASRIQFSNLCRDAHQTLSAHWMTERQAKSFLEPVRDLTRASDFFQSRHGLAVFHSADIFRVYHLTESVDERVSIARTFYLRPMVSEVEPCTPFLLLTLSKSRVAAYRVTSQSIRPAEDIQLPEGFDELLARVSADRGAQAHSSGTLSFGKQGAVFHGQGGMPDAEKSELSQYMRRVDDVIGSRLGDRGELLVLAGVDYVTNLYRDVSSYPRIAGSTLSGNVDHLNSDQLFQRVLPIAVAEAAEQRDADARRLAEPRRGPTATDPEQVLCAAYEGRIEILFFATEAELSGSFQPDTRTLMTMRAQPSGQLWDPCRDLIDAAVLQTLRHGGRVYAVGQNEMPVDKSMAAVLRY